MKEYNVVIPEEYYTIFSFIQKDLPGVASINSSLKEFEPKKVFAWHCSIMVQLNDLTENGMPSKSEIKILEDFENWLDEFIKGTDLEKPNALFLGQITWNETRELIWRVFDPEITNTFLQDLIKSKTHFRPFDYRIEQDEAWKLAEWHLENS